MKASVTDGPERSAIAAAVRTKRPAPMMAPMPSATSDQGPSVRLRGALAPSAVNRSIDLVRNNEPATMPPSVLDLDPIRVRPETRDYTRPYAFYGSGFHGCNPAGPY